MDARTDGEVADAPWPAARAAWYVVIVLTLYLRPVKRPPKVVSAAPAVAAPDKVTTPLMTPDSSADA